MTNRVPAAGASVQNLLTGQSHTLQNGDVVLVIP